MAGETDNPEVVQKLDALVRLLALQLVAEKGITEGIRLLGRAGLDRNLIAEVCGTTPGTVSVRLSEAKNQPPKKLGARAKGKES